MRVLITGANRGIGLEFVRQLAARGDRVFATCRRPDRATALNELQVQYPDLITITALEVGDLESIAASHAAISAQTDALDLLVNNAAVALEDGGLGNFDAEVMQAILMINAIAPMLVVEQYLDLLKGGEQPKIANISSRAGSLSTRNSLATYSYGASKAALNHYTHNLSYEVKADGIIAISLTPGWVRTDMGGERATIDVAESISGMVRMIDGLTMADAGAFYDYAGESVTW